MRAEANTVPHAHQTSLLAADCWALLAHLREIHEERQRDLDTFESERSNLKAIVSQQEILMNGTTMAFRPFPRLPNCKAR